MGPVHVARRSHRVGRGTDPRLARRASRDHRASYLQGTTLGGPLSITGVPSPPPKREYLDAGFEAVRKRYKTFGKYLVKGLGLNERTYLQMRKRLLS